MTIKTCRECGQQTHLHTYWCSQGDQTTGYLKYKCVYCGDWHPWHECAGSLAARDRLNHYLGRDGG